MRMLDVGPKVARRVPDDFDDEPYERFGVTPVAPTIGAEITGVDLGAPLDDELRAELHRALLEWKVLFFRDQDITREQQRAFAEHWGPLEQHPFFAYTQPGEHQDEADVVRLAKSDISPGVENEWHHDVTWHANPSLGAVIRAVELPPVGGDTLWADCAAAYDGLPSDLKDRIEHLTATHDWRETFGLVLDEERFAAMDARYPAPTHPVVRLHPETGRRTIFVNRIFTMRIDGVPEDESEWLIERLTAEVRRPEYQCRLRWTPGAVAFWDNRATMHYAVSDYHPQRRVMDRISIAGDVPFGPADASPTDATVASPA